MKNCDWPYIASLSRRFLTNWGYTGIKARSQALVFVYLVYSVSNMKLEFINILIKLCQYMNEEEEYNVLNK